MELFNPKVQVFWECDSEAVFCGVDDHIDDPMDIGRLCTEIKLARWMMSQPSGVVISLVDYEFFALTRLRVRGIQCVDEKLSTILTGKRGVEVDEKGWQRYRHESEVCLKGFV